MRLRSIALFLPLVVAFPLLTSCSTPTSGITPWQPGDNDPFAVFNEEATTKISFAQMRVRGECMVAKGYKEAATWIPTTLENPETMKIGYDGPLFRTVKEAQQNGYGHDDPGRIEMATARHANEDAAGAEALDKVDIICIDQALAKAGNNAQKDLDDYVYIAQSMNSDLNLAANELSKEPLDRIVRCLAEQKYPVTRNTQGIAGFDTTIRFGDFARPAEEPHTIIRNGMEYVAAIKPNRYIPTTKESELAAAYVECGKSTGAATDYLTVIRREQQKIVDKYDAQLTELTPRIEELAKKTEKIVGD